MVSLRSARLVHIPSDLASVTTVSPRETDPRAVGMSARGVSAIWEAVEALYRTRVQPAVALCIRRDGEVVLDRAIGHARGNAPDDGEKAPRVLATPDTPFCIFSASKAVTAVMIHLLDERGLLHVDDPVAEYIPEFALHGKDRTSIRHVLTHRAGIPSVAGAHNDVAMLSDWDRIIALLCDARPTSKPGRRLAYHAITGGFILGEILRRVTGRDIRQFFTEEFQRPAGWRWMNYGVDLSEVASVAQNAFTGAPLPMPVARLVERALGVSFEDATRISNDPRYLTGIVPAGNVVGTASEVTQFFDILLHGGALRGRQYLKPRTVRRVLTESSYLEVDLTLLVPVRYGLGVMLGGDTVSLFGPDTPHAFGHAGFINVLVWADPDRRISAALLTSGKPFFGPHLQALWGVLRAISANVPR